MPIAAPAAVLLELAFIWMTLSDDYGRIKRLNGPSSVSREIGMRCLTRTMLYILLLAPVAIFGKTEYPLTVTDGLGNTVTLAQAPLSISSKTLFTDEVLLSLVPPERLSSLTNFAANPNYSNVVNRLPKSVQLLDLNVEGILNNHPDLVFAANWSDSAKVEQLKHIGINVYMVNTPTRWQDIQQEILKIGYLLNVESQAQQLIEKRQQQLAKLADQKQKILDKNWVSLDYNTWGTASGVDTTWNAVLEEAGLINGSARFEQGPFGQVEMSKELIVEINPDVLFLPGWASNDSEVQAFYQDIIDDPALASVTAVKSGRVYAVPEHLRGTYSQYLADTIEFVITKVAADI